MPSLIRRSVFDPNDPDNFSVGALAGIIVGLICAALIVSLIFIGVARRRRQARKAADDGSSRAFPSSAEDDNVAERSASLSAYAAARRANGSIIGGTNATTVEMQRVNAGAPETREQRRERRRLERQERERQERAAGIVPMYTATSGPREIKLEEPPKYEATLKEPESVLVRGESSDSSLESSSSASEHRPAN